MNRKLVTTGVVCSLLVVLLACGDDDGGPAPPPPPPDRPDLAIGGIQIIPESPRPQDADSALVSVMNQGTAPAPASVLRVEVDGTVACDEISVPEIAAGNQALVACNLGPQPAGPHEVRACADAGGFVSEGSEQNNCAAVTLTVYPPANPGPDLIIEAIAAVPPDPAPSVPVRIDITVRNVGSEAAAASAVRLSLDIFPACAAIPAPAVPPGEAVTVRCDLPGLVCADWTMRACADVDGAVSETFEQNNCLSDTLRVGPCSPEPWEPPRIPRAPIRREIHFGSSAPSALEAEALVASRVGEAVRADSVTSTPLARLAGLIWSAPPQGCYTAVVAEGSCTTTYRFCIGGLESWEVSCVEDGACDGHLGEEFVAWDGRIEMESPAPVPLFGRISFYTPSGSGPSISLRWEVEADEAAGTWEWYGGIIDPGLRRATFQYNRDPDGTEHLEWERVGEVQWSLQANAAGTGGSISIRRWAGPGWQDEHEILWQPDGHGSWTNHQTDPPEVRTW